MYSRQEYFLQVMALGMKTPCEDDGILNDNMNDWSIYDWSRNESFHCWDMAAAAQVVGKSGSIADFYPDGFINVLDYGLMNRMNWMREQIRNDPTFKDPGLFLRITPDTKLKYRPPDGKAQCAASRRKLVQQIGADWAVSCPRYLPTDECHYDCSANAEHCLHSIAPVLMTPVAGSGSWYKVPLPMDWTAFSVRFKAAISKCASNDPSFVPTGGSCVQLLTVPMLAALRHPD